jgi:hypothetical protein
MAQVSITDVVVPAEFTAYQVENSFVNTAFFQSGVAVRNGVIEEQLSAGAMSFTVPTWGDAGETEPNYSDDNAAHIAGTLKVSAYPQVVRKAFVNQGWSVANLPLKTFRGLAVVIDDNLYYGGTAPNIKYVTVLFGEGAVGYGFVEPRMGYGTELFRIPSAGQGGGITQLWSRANLAIAPLGWSFTDGTLAGDSPSLTELATASHWTRVSVSRKQCPIAFLLTR